MKRIELIDILKNFCFNQPTCTNCPLYEQPVCMFKDMSLISLKEAYQKVKEFENHGHFS